MEIGYYTFGEADVQGQQDRLRDLIAEAGLADQVGLDIFGVGEHHRPDYSVSAPAIVLAAAAATTEVSENTLSRLRDLPERWAVPRFPLRGADALELGMPPGPEVGQVLRDLERWWIEGDFAADEAELRVRLAQIIRGQ